MGRPKKLESLVRPLIDVEWEVLANGSHQCIATTYMMIRSLADKNVGTPRKDFEQYAENLQAYYTEVEREGRFSFFTTNILEKSEIEGLSKSKIASLRKMHEKDAVTGVMDYAIEALMYKKGKGTKPEDFVPSPLVPLVGTVSADATKKINSKIEVDAEAFHRMVVTVVKSAGTRYSGVTGAQLLGKMRGAKDNKEALELYRESLAFVEEANKKQKENKT